MSRQSGLYAEKASVNFGSVTTSVVATTVAVPGAALGDFALASLSTMTTTGANDIVMTAVVSAADTVTVSLLGDATGFDPAAGTLRVMVIPFGNAPG